MILSMTRGCQRSGFLTGTKKMAPFAPFPEKDSNGPTGLAPGNPFLSTDTTRKEKCSQDIGTQRRSSTLSLPELTCCLTLKILVFSLSAFLRLTQSVTLPILRSATTSSSTSCRSKICQNLTPSSKIAFQKKPWLLALSKANKLWSKAKLKTKSREISSAP